MNTKCPHGCGVELKEDDSVKPLGRTLVFICPRCKCIFGFVLIRMSEKCSKEKFKNGQQANKVYNQKKILNRKGSK